MVLKMLLSARNATKPLSPAKRASATTLLPIAVHNIAALSKRVIVPSGRK